MSLKDQIIAAANANKGKMIPVKAWGQDAFIRVMSGTERDAFEAASIDKDGKATREKFRARLLVKTLADENSARIFTDEDAHTLSDMDGKELGRLFDIAAQANGLTKEDEEELLKNS